MELSLRVEGSQIARQKLEGMASRLTDLRPCGPEIKMVVQRHESKWLGSEGEGTFAPLAASTLKRRRRSHHPLDKTGTGWDSLVMDTGFTFYAVSQYVIEVGTSADWMHWHMFPRVYTPARPPIHATPTLIADVGGVFRAYVRGTQTRLL